jgi:hypothetical protein
MLVFFIILIATIIHFILYRRLERKTKSMITYQNFKTNILFREMVGSKNFDIYSDTNDQIYYLKKKFAWAAEDEISDSGKKEEIIKSIRDASRIFHTETHPFHGFIDSEFIYKYGRKSKK